MRERVRGRTKGCEGGRARKESACITYRQGKVHCTLPRQDAPPLRGYCMGAWSNAGQQREADYSDDAKGAHFNLARGKHPSCASRQVMGGEAFSCLCSVSRAFDDGMQPRVRAMHIWGQCRPPTKRR